MDEDDLESKMIFRSWGIFCKNGVKNVQDCLVAWPGAPWCVFIEDERRHQVLLEEVTIGYSDGDADGDGDGVTDGDGDGDNDILYIFTFSLQTRK